MPSNNFFFKRLKPQTVQPSATSEGSNWAVRLLGQVDLLFPLRETTVKGQRGPGVVVKHEKRV